MFNFLSILFGFTFQYSIDFIGKLYVSQIIIMITFFILFFKKNKEFKIYNKTIFILAFLWLINQIISDIFNESVYRDYARGNIKIILTIFAFYVFDRFSNLKKDSLLIIIFWIFTISELYDLFRLNTSNFASIWKFGLGITVTFLVLFIDHFTEQKRKKLTGIIIFLIGVFSLLVGTRYLFLFNTITCFFLFQNLIFKNPNKKKLIFSFIGFGTLFFSMISIYNYSMKSGLLDQNFTSKTLRQSSGDYGVFLGGRHEILSSYKAIIDAPIIGHGSWAKNCAYIDYLNTQLYKLNYNIVREYGDCQIPAHSVILESWVNSGIFGFIFWLYILRLLVIKFKNIVLNSSTTDPIFIFIITMCFWDILFSPYGSNRILLLPLFLMYLLKYSNYKKI
jgi:hypothetical protein